MIPQQKSAESGFQVISEEIFMKFSIGKSYIPKYMNEWYALVIIGNDNRYYINFEGKCAVAVTEDDVKNFLKEITLPPKVDTNLPQVPNIQIWPLDSINLKVFAYLATLEINFQNVGESTISRLDEILSKKENRMLDIEPLYYTIGEYFRYSIGDKFDWKNVREQGTVFELPILICEETKEKILIESSLKTTLSDQRFSSPIREAINLIFRKM
jgi:hypothetical protein